MIRDRMRKWSLRKNLKKLAENDVSMSGVTSK